MERITLVIAVVALLLGGWNWIGGDSTSIGGPTRLPNSDFSAQTITSNGALTSTGVFTATGAINASSTLLVDGVISGTAESNKLGSANSFNPTYYGAGDGCTAVIFTSSSTQTTQATSTSFCNP